MKVEQHSCHEFIVQCNSISLLVKYRRQVPDLCGDPSLPSGYDSEESTHSSSYSSPTTSATAYHCLEGLTEHKEAIYVTLGRDVGDQSTIVFAGHCFFENQEMGCGRRAGHRHFSMNHKVDPDQTPPSFIRNKIQRRRRGT